MSYLVTTPIFEGPLDLLLRLITERQLEITEVSLAGLVDEYLGHLSRIEALDLEVTSEFLLIAATLIQLKARRLLPGGAPVDPDEELALAEERDRLLSRLLACLTFKDVAAVLAHRFEGAARFVERDAGPDPDVVPRPPLLRLPCDAAALARLAARLLDRKQEPDLDHLDLDLPSVAAAIDAVRVRLGAEIELDFERLTADLRRPVEVVAYFLAVLELVRWGLVEATQEHPAKPILLRHRREPDAGLVSEWQK